MGRVSEQIAIEEDSGEVSCDVGAGADPLDELARERAQGICGIA